MISRPLSHFPEKMARFILPGKIGKLEVIATPTKNNSRNCVVICHPHPQHGGTMNNKVITTLERTLQSLGLNSVRFNFRGVGQSEGSFADGQGETEDLISIIDWLQAIDYIDNLWLAGFSFGAYIAYRATVLSKYSKKVSQLITVAPPIQYEGFANLPSPICPWLVIQGEKDEIVDPNAVYAWLAQHQPAPTLIKLANADHFFHHQLTTLKQTILETLS